MQHALGDLAGPKVKPTTGQLLKWVGNKQRFASEIVSRFPTRFGTYYEPFIGSGAVLAALAPKRAVASDTFRPLIEIWEALKTSPKTLVGWYAERWNRSRTGEKVPAYEATKASFNASPNGADLVFLCRACYGGIVRFRQLDGYMSTPCGPHDPIAPESFAERVEEWHKRVQGTVFRVEDFEEAMSRAQSGDLIYCDPPYVESQKILYGAQRFTLKRLYGAIQRCKNRGVRVALSIDGTKRSGARQCQVEAPTGLFVREEFIQCGRSMLKRLQMEGETLEDEEVTDRLLLTF